MSRLAVDKAPAPSASATTSSVPHQKRARTTASGEDRKTTPSPDLQDDGQATGDVNGEISSSKPVTRSAGGAKSGGQSKGKRRRSGAGVGPPAQPSSPAISAEASTAQTGVIAEADVADEVMPAAKSQGLGVSQEVGARLEAELISLRALALRTKGLFEWVDGPLVTAMRWGELLLLDELSLAEDAVIERLNSVLEPGRSITLAEKGGEGSAGGQGLAETVVAAPGFRCVWWVHCLAEQAFLPDECFCFFGVLWRPVFSSVNYLIIDLSANYLFSVRLFALCTE